MLKPHGEPAALSPRWGPKRWPDPPGLRWLLLLVPHRGETKQLQQSEVLAPVASTEPGQPWGTPCPTSRSPVSPKAAPWGAQSVCRTTEPVEAPSPGCTGPPPPRGPHGHLHPRGPPRLVDKAAWRPLPFSWGTGAGTTGAVPTQGVVGKGWSPAWREKGMKKSFTC